MCDDIAPSVDRHQIFRSSADYGGLENNFVGEVPEDLYCGICTKVPR